MSAIPASDAGRCPCCGAQRSSPAFAVHDRNRLTSRHAFRYDRCSSCATLWLRDVPDDLSAHYPADYHDLPGRKKLVGLADAEEPRLALVTEYVRSGRLFEIGPSNGAFSAAARRAGFEVTALEMDAAACEHLVRVVGAQAVNTADPAVALRGLGTADAVVMWHVLEHVPGPLRLLEAIAHSLRPGGVLALAVPNPESLQARMFRRRWVHVDAPRHLTFMPLAALRGAVAPLGLWLASATTVDPVGLQLNALGWERSLVAEPLLRTPPPRFSYTFGRLGSLLRPVERRGLRGAAYTAVFIRT
jgi:2-polyprenyl-3-methyl-5-hydroxy-6-metoxy-1,4-benzoquinol methylase